MRMFVNKAILENSACYGGLGLRNAIRRFHAIEGLTDPFPRNVSRATPAFAQRSSIVLKHQTLFVHGTRQRLREPTLEP